MPLDAPPLDTLPLSLLCFQYLQDGQPTPPTQSVADKLRAAGLRALVTGHQPHGDAPVVMRCPPSASCTKPSKPMTDTESTASLASASLASAPPPEPSHEPPPLLIITADSSFSSDVVWLDETQALDSTRMGPPPPVPSAEKKPALGPPRGPPPPPPSDPRGKAIFEVLLRPFETLPPASSRSPSPSPSPSPSRTPPPPPPFARAHGVLSDGRAFDSALDGSEEKGGGGLVGRTVEDGRWWVKGQLADGTWLASRGEGYTVKNFCYAPAPER